MIDAAFAAANQIFTPPFRAVLWKSMALTLALLAALGFGLNKLFVAYVHTPAAWLTTAAHVAAGLGFVIAVAFLVTPVSFVVAGFFFDELADHAEDAVHGPGHRGRAMALGPAVVLGARFALLSLAVNLVALVLLLVPGVNAVAFFGANAYLLGRGYFELAALRYRTLREAKALRERHRGTVLLAGGLMAGVLAVPVLNLLLPLFASAFMVRVAQPLLARAPQAIR